MRCISFLILASTLFVASCDSLDSKSNATHARSVQPAASQAEPPSDEEMATWEEMSIQPLIRRWLNGENLDGQFVDLDWREGSEWVSPNQMQAKVALIDVDGDGRKELAYQTGCAPVGNCLFNIYRQEGDGYKQILAADMVQTFELRKVKTKGFYDVETRSHDSATSGGIAVYRFSTTEYSISECFGYEYELTGKYDGNGQSIVADKPRLTKADCSKWPSVDIRR